MLWKMAVWECLMSKVLAFSSWSWQLFQLLRAADQLALLNTSVTFETLTLRDETSLTCSLWLLVCMVSYKKRTVGQRKEDLVVACSLAVCQDFSL